jgi:hypothetical protein
MRRTRLVSVFTALFTFTALLVALSCPARAFGATLHAILVGDVDDPTIGIGTAVDLNVLTRAVQRFALYSDMNLSQTILSGDQYDPLLLLNVINKLAVEPDDVVIYYHLSHGFRTPSTTSPYPNLFFGWQEWALSVDDIVRALKRKSQRLTLVIADVCNNVVAEHAAPRLYHERLTKPTQRAKRFYRHLFRDYHGFLVACGAHPGQYSWINVEQGSFFTKCLLQSFTECTAIDGADWNTLLTMAQRKTLTLSLSFTDATPQEPYFNIALLGKKESQD